MCSCRSCRRAPRERWAPELTEPAASAAPPGGVVDQEALRAHIRDLASLLALPALWQGSQPEAIVRGLREALVSLLRLDAVALRLAPTGEDALVDGQAPPGRLLELLGEVAADFAAGEEIMLSELLSDPREAPAGHVLAVRPGVASVSGAVVGFSSRADFPTAYERFLFQAAVDQAAVALQSTERLRQTQVALQTRDTFFSIAAHELRSPMTSLLASVQLLKRMTARTDALDPTLLDRRLAMVESQVQRLNRLTGQLLDVTRMVTGKLTIAPQPTDLAALTCEVVQAVQARTTSHPIVLAVPARLVALVDPLRLDQVVSNLVDNAVKYSPDGGPITVAITQPTDRTIELSVEDEGLGIAPEHRERIFERAYQIDSGSYVSGLGLGLYISRQIVDAHDGRIWVESGLRGGSRFVVQLPLRLEPAA
ncbi:MAG: hypothetical protein QOF51_3456 [Chloroflexota bacterium]|nr:hypothetical protein [Chloroflexota bacterium]